MRKLGMEWCRACIARRSRRVVTDIQMFSDRKKLEPGVYGLSADNCWVWFDHAVEHDGRHLSALSSCPYCLELIKRWKLPFKTDEDVNELRRRCPEEPYPGFWWHLKRWLRVVFWRRYARCRHCKKWLTKQYVLSGDFGAACVECVYRYRHSQG